METAVKKCRTQGGSEACEVKLTYYNQFVAVAWGDTNYRGVGRQTAREANQDAMQLCSEATTNCKIVHAECSDPVWVQ